ncbi:hypothetical protein GQ55_5G502300 [Panicum hallii var. hallii]|uniref:Uncharacterized protein n=1 Tax=Panicum hallii var. hallii TaxID=1504633 RepID=A0A2T7DRZ6_9POAL|nr:hypothetical protein GQ55_5G502300 [Panicum hallii var. hallii]
MNRTKQPKYIEVCWPGFKNGWHDMVHRYFASDSIEPHLAYQQNEDFLQSCSGRSSSVASYPIHQGFSLIRNFLLYLS